MCSLNESFSLHKVVSFQDKLRILLKIVFKLKFVNMYFSQAKSISYKINFMIICFHSNTCSKVDISLQIVFKRAGALQWPFLIE